MAGLGQCAGYGNERYLSTAIVAMQARQRDKNSHGHRLVGPVDDLGLTAVRLWSRSGHLVNNNLNWLSFGSATPEYLKFIDTAA